jgi:ADP-ribose pyrophosphatase YjhB (NUDIX family)
VNIGHEGETDLPRMTRVAAYGLVVDDRGQILLVRISPGYTAVGQWTLPGGGLDFGEEPAHGAIRELEEETGYRGEIERLEFVGSWTRGPIPSEGWGPFHAIQIVYRMRITGGELRHETDESTDMAAWVPLAEARELPIVDLVQEALDHLEATQVALAD